MTTIALDADGNMAADTQATWQDVITRKHKLVRLPCGGVAGFSGDSGENQRLADWMASGEPDEPPKCKDSHVLVAYGDGRRGWVAGGKWTLDHGIGPLAIGSGMQAAMVLMLTGKTALEAVEGAALVDPNTSGPFDVMRVEPVKPRKRKE